MKVKLTRNNRFCIRSAGCDRLADYVAGTILAGVTVSTNDGWTIVKLNNGETIDGPADLFEEVKEHTPKEHLDVWRTGTIRGSGFDVCVSG